MTKLGELEDLISRVADGVTSKAQALKWYSCRRCQSGVVGGYEAGGQRPGDEECDHQPAPVGLDGKSKHVKKRDSVFEHLCNLIRSFLSDPLIPRRMTPSVTSG